MLIKSILFVGLIFFSWGCASTPKVNKVDVVSKKVVEPVAPADLRACPCGRSDWDKLPPGHKKAPK